MYAMYITTNNNISKNLPELSFKKYRLIESWVNIKMNNPTSVIKLLIYNNLKSNLSSINTFNVIQVFLHSNK
jgi:hypothetical protein